jgi:ATP-binding cassette, subfamily D (ALD), peroxisomal long-chain fatty acid import protein
MWSAAGYALISIPVWLATRRSVGIQAPSSESPENAVADRTESLCSTDRVQLFVADMLSPDYISSRRLLLSLADAGGRLMYAYKDILELAGLTTRIYTMLSTLHHLQPLPGFETDENKIEFQGAVIGIPKRDSRLGETSLIGNAEEGFDFGDGSDSTDSARAERPLVTDLNIRIERGEHLMISGPVGWSHLVLCDGELTCP